MMARYTLKYQKNPAIIDKKFVTTFCNQLFHIKKELIQITNELKQHHIAISEKNILNPTEYFIELSSRYLKILEDYFQVVHTIQSELPSETVFKGKIKKIVDTLFKPEIDDDLVNTRIYNEDYRNSYDLAKKQLNTIQNKTPWDDLYHSYFKGNNLKYEGILWLFFPFFLIYDFIKLTIFLIHGCIEKINHLIEISEAQQKCADIYKEYKTIMENSPADNLQHNLFTVGRRLRRHSLFASVQKVPEELSFTLSDASASAIN